VMRKPRHTVSRTRATCVAKEAGCLQRHLPSSAALRDWPCAAPLLDQVGKPRHLAFKSLRNSIPAAGWRGGVPGGTPNGPVTYAGLARQARTGQTGCPRRNPLPLKSELPGQPANCVRAACGMAHALWPHPGLLGRRKRYLVRRRELPRPAPILLTKPKSTAVKSKTRFRPE
jgi:hypothetical protein